MQADKLTDTYRGHVAQDILPYMCIFEDCATPNDMYLTSEELIKHMRTNHSVPRWICSYCSSKSEDRQQFVFESLADWESHMQRAHVAAFTPAQLPALSRVSRRDMLDALSCPLCSYTTSISRPSLDDHIIQHMHGFALRCLPWVINGTDEKSANTNSSSYGSHLSAFVGEHFDDGELECPSLSELACHKDLLTNVMGIIRHLKESDTPASIQITTLFAHSKIWDRIESTIQNFDTNLSRPDLPHSPLGEMWESYFLRIGHLFRQLSSVDNDTMDVTMVAREAKEILEWELDDLNDALLRSRQGKHIYVDCYLTCGYLMAEALTCNRINKF